MSTRACAILPALLLLCSLILTSSTARSQGAEDLTIWPNRASKANSDEWLARNHDRIRLMRPQLLVINFVNGLSPEAGRQKVDRLIAALKESSRYHGYRDEKAPAFLDYQVAKYVDLQDETSPADPLDGNSNRYPRVPNWKEGINFQYARLFDEQFAGHYEFKDPRRPAQMMKLAELVQSGLVHEVWFLARQRQLGAPFESVEVKQAYSSRFEKLAGVSKQAGNGGDPAQPFIGRSLRILFINAERGPGCAMESLGHSMEGMSNSGAIPYFTKYFKEYAGFDLDRRFKLPFNSFYARGRTDLSYPDPRTLVFTDRRGREVTVRDYYVVGGNVHFTPSGRKDYDLDNPAPVMASIEDYRIGSGPGGQDLLKEWNVQVFKRFNQLANDCMGPWLVYWRQNMPGYKNRARDGSRRPMKNWWPFLFY